jgi:TetR/AcrR family transcriptional repressor of uid operon
MQNAITFAVEEPRRDRIMAAAERAFAHHGFHGASMQHLAAEAAMSAGNLYRSFTSKDAIVLALAQRDRITMARDIEALGEAPDLVVALSDLLRRRLVEEPVWRTQLVLEIWAEAARNPAIAAMCTGMMGEIEGPLTHLIQARQARGQPAFIIRVLHTVVSGLFKRRATEPAVDGESEIALALGIIAAALDGTLVPLFPPSRANP